MALGPDDSTLDAEHGGSPQRLGPYRLLRALGRGGMGEVWLAEAAEASGDVEAGQRVALKLLHSDRLGQPEALRRFLREVELGRSLREPTLVRILDSGRILDERGLQRPYLAMEQVEGRSLREILDEERSLSEPLLRAVAVQLAEALDALHSVGVVHRDVKPANVLVTPEHRVKLGDLGVAHLQRRDLRMTSTDEFVGTLSYAAPELFEGPGVSPAADLYSLGVLLYEAATGDCPFQGESFAELAELHRRHHPPRVGRIRPQLTLFFEEIVTTLLRKQPRHRFRNGGELLTVLEGAERSAWWRAREGEVDRSGRRGVARRLRARVRPDAVFVGRDAALAALLEAERRLGRGGGGGALLIEAEPGFGKTRLLAEFVERSDAGAGLVLLGRHRSAEPSPEPEGLLEALARHFGSARLGAELASRLPDSPVQAALLEGHLLGEPSGLEDARSAFAAVQASARAVLRALSREQPVVLLVEDLHRLGGARRELLEPLVELAAEEAVLLVLTRRPEPQEADPLAGPLARGLVSPLGLPRLDRDGVERLLASVLGARLPAAEAAPGVGRRSAGNPFFVLELAHAMRAGGGRLPRRDDGGETLPGGLQRLLLERIKGLEEPDRVLLQAAAILGPSFDPHELAAVVERSSIDVLRSLDRLERTGGLIHPAGAAVEFEHDLLREAIEADLSIALRREYHERIARAHAVRRGLDLGSGHDGDEEDAVFLAHHLLQCAEARQGLPWVPRALDRLLRTARNEQLLRTSALALKAAREDELDLRVSIRLREADCLELLGRVEEHHDRARSALLLAERCGDRDLQLRALAHLFHARLVRHDLDGARELAMRRLAGAERGGDGLALARARGALGLLERACGRPAAARPQVRRALALAREAGSESEQARLSILLGQLDQEQGNPLRARERFRRARRLAARAGDPRTEVSALGNLANVEQAIGEPSDAEALLLEHVRLSRDLGFRQGRLVSTNNLAALRIDQGRYQEACELAAEVEALADSPTSRLALHARLARAEARLSLGFVGEGRSLVEELAASAGSARRGLLGGALARLHALMDWLEGRPDEAEKRLLGEEEPTDGRQAMERGLLLAELAWGGEPSRRRERAELALERSRRGGQPAVLAAAATVLARVEIDEDRKERALPLLHEAAAIVRRQWLAFPGPLPAAYLALLGAGEVEGLPPESGSPAWVRSEAHLALHRAGAGPSHLHWGRELWEQLGAHLNAKERSAQRSRHPVARALFAEP